jgi:hypothetical protein
MACVALACAAFTLPLTAAGGTELASADRILSNDRTVTWWSYVGFPAFVRARPTLASPAIGRLRLETEDGFPEVYVLLRARITRQGSAWVQVRLPGRPNGRVGWVPERALGPPSASRLTLKIDRARLEATLYKAGHRIWSAPVGVGALASPTPAGRYWIRELIRPAEGTIYGPYAFGTSAYSRLSEWPGGGVVGIHGTDEPWLVPGRPSHGCIRMHNADIAYLARHLPVGSSVVIV